MALKKIILLGWRRGSEKRLTGKGQKNSIQYVVWQLGWSISLWLTDPAQHNLAILNGQSVSKSSGIGMDGFEQKE